MDQVKIGKFIATLRKEKGYTQEELATKLNVSNKSISRWENGRTMPDLSIIPTLCDILGITINELLSGEKINSSEYQKRLEENIIINIDLLKKKIKDISKKIVIILLSSIILTIILLFGFIFYKELTYIKIPIDDNNITIKPCTHKNRLGYVISTKDNTAFLYDSYYDSKTKTYFIEDVFRYVKRDNMKDISSSMGLLFEKSDVIEKIVYKDKIIYEVGDELKECNWYS
jgi:transcriptional regulator with XRE-family HTH domain